MSKPSPDVEQIIREAAIALPEGLDGEGYAQAVLIIRKAVEQALASAPTADMEKIARELAFIEWSGRHTLETCHPDAAERIRRMARKAYDTATAKAREEYEEVLTDHRRLVRELDVALNGGGAARQASLCDIVAQVRQLAHQPLDSARDKQPSAPTADMEKIARDCCHDIENRSDDCDMVMHAKVMKALAQVRAPLVELETKWQERINRYKDKKSHAKGTDIPNQGGKIKATIECLQDLRAALTGTGEWQQALDQSRESNEEIARLVQRIRELEQKLLCEK